jgi:hypothetical protein
MKEELEENRKKIWMMECDGKHCYKEAFWAASPKRWGVFFFPGAKF